jgi:hypothetical protein
MEKAKYVLVVAEPHDFELAKGSLRENAVVERLLDLFYRD